MIKKNFEILKYDGIRAQRMGKLPYAIKCFEEASTIDDKNGNTEPISHCLYTGKPTR